MLLCIFSIDETTQAQDMLNCLICSLPGLIIIELPIPIEGFIGLVSPKGTYFFL